MIGGSRGRRRIANALFVGACLIAIAGALIVLGAILASLVSDGIGGLNLAVFTQDTPPPGSPGGLRNAIIGSIVMSALAMAVAIALGVLAGVWLAEYGGEGRLARIVRFANDVLLSAPSILIGLFVYELAVRPLHGFSGLAGALALAFIAAPIVTRATEDVLALQSRALRESGAAVGAPKGLVIRRLLWRAAGGGIATGVLLAFARISGETAPLLFTSLNNEFFSLDMLGPMANLPVVIFNFALSAYGDWRRLAWAAALLIAAAVLAVNLVVRLVARDSARA